MDGLLPPHVHMGAGNLPELLRPAQAHIGLKVCDVLAVGPPSVQVGEIGEPFERRGNLYGGLKLVSGESCWRGDMIHRGRGGRHGGSLTPETMGQH
jgi:hypothetical protein